MTLPRSESSGIGSGLLAPLYITLAMAVVGAIIGSIDLHLLLSGKGTLMERFAITAPSADKVLLVTVASMSGVVIAGSLQKIWFWVCLVTAAALFSFASHRLFWGEPFGIWWVIPNLTLLAAAFTSYSLRGLSRIRSNERLRNCLGGILPKSLIDDIVRKTAILRTDTRQVSGSVVAIEIDGIDSIRNRFEPKDIFYELRRVNQLLEILTLRHGGVKIPGYCAGFLVFFGDRLVANSSTRWHAEQSLQFSSDLQTENANAASDAAAAKRPVIALRMGVSSGQLILGNIGTPGQFDFTLLGDEVARATSYAHNAEVNSVLFSRMTRDLLVKINPNSDLFSRKLQNFHVGELAQVHEVYEFDPFATNPDLKRSLSAAQREAACIVRNEKRYPAPLEDSLHLETNFGNARLINFSRNGMGVLLKAPLGKGTSVRAQLKAESNTLMNRLQNRNVGTLIAEVKWTRPEGEFHLHGMNYKNLEEADKDFLMQVLLEHHQAWEQSKKVA